MSRLARSVLLLWGVLALVACAPTGQPPVAVPDTSVGAPSETLGSCAPDAIQVGPSAIDLQDALDGAKPGDVFQLAPVTYQGRFHAQVAGSADSRILLCGVAGSVFDGGDTEDGYALHLDGASYWDIRDVSIRGAQKGIVLDATSHTTLSDLRISDVGQEGLHLRANSSDNLVQRIRVERTGLVDPSFGEGVYVGSAQSNWCRYTSCQPDRSDRNTFEQLSISDTMAEAVDIKEGTSDGVVRDSTLTVSAQAVVDSVVDVKGSGWTLDANMVVGAVDAISVHVILPPWGSANVLVRNQLSPTSGGLGVHLVGAARAAANRVGCDNTTPEGVELTNIACA